MLVLELSCISYICSMVMKRKYDRTFQGYTITPALYGSKSVPQLFLAIYRFWVRRIKKKDFVKKSNVVGDGLLLYIESLYTKQVKNRFLSEIIE